MRSLSRALAAPERLPSANELGEFHGMLDATVPTRSYRLRSRLARPLPIVLAGVIAATGSSVAAAASGVPLPSPLRSAAVVLGLPIDDGSVATTKGDISAVSGALAAGNRADVEQARNTLNRQLNQLSAADLKKIKGNAEATVAKASAWLDRIATSPSASSTTGQKSPSTTLTTTVAAGSPGRSGENSQATTTQTSTDKSGNHSGRTDDSHRASTSTTENTASNGDHSTSTSPSRSSDGGDGGSGSGSGQTSSSNQATHGTSGRDGGSQQSTGPGTTDRKTDTSISSTSIPRDSSRRNGSDQGTSGDSSQPRHRIATSTTLGAVPTGTTSPQSDGADSRATNGGSSGSSASDNGGHGSGSGE